MQFCKLPVEHGTGMKTILLVRKGIKIKSAGGMGENSDPMEKMCNT